MRLEHRACVLVCAAALACGAWSARGEDAGAALEKVKPSLVQVTFYQLDENGARHKRTTVGTVVAADGLVAFSAEYMPAQVPEDRFEEFKVEFVHEKDHPDLAADFLSRDPDLGAAVIRVSEKPPEGLVFTPAAFAKDPGLKPGQPVLGFGLLGDGYGSTANFGLGNVIKSVEKPQPLVLCTYPINIALFGPVTSMNGEVVGFVIRDPLAGGRGYTYGSAVVLPAARLENLLKNPGKPKERSWVGISDLQPVPKDLAQVLGLSENGGGVLIGRVLAGMPAEMAGLKVEDVLLKLDDEKIDVKDETGLKGFMERLKRLQVGQKVVFIVWRGGAEQKIDLTVGERPKEAGKAQRVERKDLGLVLRELVYYDTLGLDLPPDLSGLYVHYVKSGSWPELGGLRAGDIITKVDDVQLKGSGEETFVQFNKLIDELKEKKKKEFVFFVSRGVKGQNSAFIKVEADWK
ncbi:MAG: PDZ domain-containing protein [Planctomycetes bacterium]|nr:PDZ domain-containing protein [Planctomycetota bacterium]